QRILHELDDHLDDGRMHIIAPPGSGKTVLGLELMLRLNQATLILAPTLAIKHQWESRFLQLFLQSDKRPDWISMDIKHPAFVTITTYQSLYSLHKAAQENSAEKSEQMEEAEGIIEEVLPNEAKSIL